MGEFSLAAVHFLTRESAHVSKMLHCIVLIYV
jgi:hypothetical protein